MSEYKAVPIKFANKGVIQRVDTDFLTDGQFYDLVNATSIHEGAISSRFGSTRLATPSPGDLINTLELFQVEASDDRRYLYIGEGTEIYRVRLDAFGTSTALNAALPSWGQRWSAVKFNTGLSGKPYFFVAGGKMLKDQAITQAGVATTAFQNWGIIPPPAAPLATEAAELSVSLLTGPSATTTWTVSPDESSTYKEIILSSSAVDLSKFSATVPSGKSVDGYDSDDYIELKFTLKNPSKFDNILLQFDVSASAGTYLDYYQKAIVPSTTTSTINRDGSVLSNTAQRVYLVDSGTLGDQPISTTNTTAVGAQVAEMPPVTVNESSPSEITVQIKKSEFLRIGQAGKSGKTWANVKGFRAWAQYGNIAGGADQTLVFGNIKMIGGSGPNNVDAGTAPYDWVYTYRNDATGHESNPCPMMGDDRYMKNLRRKAVDLTGIAVSSDSQVSSIAIYRRGGVYSDSEYRLIGYTNNTAGISTPGYTAFTDNISDSDLLYARLCEWDNDPPVPSKLPVSLMATYAGNSAGTQTVTLTVTQPASVKAETFLTAGTRLQITDNDKSEEIQVISVGGTGGNDLTANFQYAHSGTVKVTTSTVCGAACRFSAVVGESIFLAGDQNNPSYVYKCKAGKPESFPVVTEATSKVNQVIVSGPSNPIHGLTEFGGECVSLNRNNLYVIRVFNGQLQAPVETPAQRGLLCEKAWCKADNELYYLSDDGVYAWAGGQSVKKSEQIDWFFKGKEVNGRAPMARASADLQYVAMAYFQNEVYLACRDSNGYSRMLVYHTIYDRWTFYTPALEGHDYAGWSMLLSAPNGKLYSSRYFTTDASTACYLYEESYGQDDNGSLIDFAVQTGFYTMGDASMQKQWGDVVLEANLPADSVVKVYYDFSTTESETFNITGSGTATRRRIPLPLNSGNGQEAYAIAFRFESNSEVQAHAVLHSITFNVLPLAAIQRGRATDWDDYGYPHDKRLDQLIIEYDTGGTSVTLNLDTISGISGNTPTTAVATFTLTGSGRSKATLPIKAAADGNPVVAKMVRLRPTATSADFKIHTATITFEKFPADKTLFTDPSDYGTPFDKHFQQLVLDIDTGGQAATVEVFIDNASTASQSLTVNTTSKTRQQNLTLKAGLTGKKAYLKITPHANGKSQLFGHTFVTMPADKGAVFHSYDWDDLGTANDKRLFNCAIEYEVTASTVMVIEGIGGVSPADQVATQIMTFTLEPTGRKKQTINIPDGTVVKMVRIYPQTNSPNTAAKIYKVEWDKIVYPNDATLFTDWEDLGYPCEKVFRTVTVDVDTGGSDATMYVEVDGTVRGTFTVNTTSTDRVRTYSFVSDTDNTVVIGKLVRLRFALGASGKAQLFRRDFSFTREPCPMTFFDTFEQYFGANGYKYMKQIWMEYRSTGEITVTVYRDNGQLFYSFVLPPHTHRDVERVYLPASNNGTPNKSKSYRVTMEAAASSEFYLYRDSSRIETMLLSGDARAPFNQHYLFAEMPIQK